MMTYKETYAAVKYEIANALDAIAWNLRGYQTDLFDGFIAQLSTESDRITYGGERPLDKIAAAYSIASEAQIEAYFHTLNQDDERLYYAIKAHRFALRNIVLKLRRAAR